MQDQNFTLTSKTLKDDSLPLGWSVSVSFLTKIHRLWKMTEKAKIYRNPENFLSLIGGHLFSFSFHDNRFIKLAALSTLAVKRFAAFQQQLTLTKNSYKQLSQSAQFLFGAPSQGKIQRTLFRIKLIAKTSSRFLKESMTSSLRLVDVIDSITNPDAKEAMNEFFVNTVENAAWLAKNRDSLIEEFQKHEITIKKVFEHLGVAITTEQVLSSLKATLNTAEKVVTVTKSINHKTAKSALFGGAFALGAENFLPSSLINDEEEEFTMSCFIPQDVIKLPNSVDKRKRFRV